MFILLVANVLLALNAGLVHNAVLYGNGGFMQSARDETSFKQEMSKEEFASEEAESSYSSMESAESAASLSNLGSLNGFDNSLSRRSSSYGEMQKASRSVKSSSSSSSLSSSSSSSSLYAANNVNSESCQQTIDDLISEIQALKLNVDCEVYRSVLERMDDESATNLYNLVKLIREQSVSQYFSDVNVAYNTLNMYNQQFNLKELLKNNNNNNNVYLHQIFDDFGKCVNTESELYEVLETIYGTGNIYAISTCNSLLFDVLKKCNGNSYESSTVSSTSSSVGNNVAESIQTVNTRSISSNEDLYSRFQESYNLEFKEKVIKFFQMQLQNNDNNLAKLLQIITSKNALNIEGNNAEEVMNLLISIRTLIINNECILSQDNSNGEQIDELNSKLQKLFEQLLCKNISTDSAFVSYLKECYNYNKYNAAYLALILNSVAQQQYGELYQKCYSTFSQTSATMYSSSSQSSSSQSSMAAMSATSETSSSSSAGSINVL